MTGAPRIPSAPMGDWIRDGACGDEDPEIFWPQPGPNNVVRAREICDRCPVLTPCRAWALANNPAGFWGGMSDTDRRTLKRGGTNTRTTAAGSPQPGSGPPADRADRTLVGSGIGS